MNLFELFLIIMYDYLEKIYFSIKKSNILSLYKIMLERIESEQKYKEYMIKKGFHFDKGY